MKSLLKTLFRISAWLGVFLGIVLFILYLVQGYFVYPGRAIYRGENPEWQERVTLGTITGYSSVQVESSDRQSTIHGLWSGANGKGAPAILWFHGNDEGLAEIGYQLKPMREMGYNIFAMEYRGFGRSTGAPSEKGLLADAEAVYDYLEEQGEIRSGKIVAGGRSLGASVALELAASRDCAAVVMLTPFTTLPDFMKQRFPWIPVGYLVSDRYDALALLRDAPAPVFIAIGPKDPYHTLAMAEALAAAGGDSVKTYSVPGAGYDDFFSKGGSDLWDEVSTFIDKNTR